MKTLSEFINSIPNTDYIYPDDFAQSFDRFMMLNKVNEDTITSEMCSWFAKHVCEGKNRPIFDKFTDDVPATSKYITEMLKTADIKVLIKRLNKVLGGDTKVHIKFLSDTEEKNGRKMFNLLVPQKLYDKDLIENTCDKMLWTVTQIYTDNFARPFMNPKKGKANFTDIDGNEKSTVIVVEPTYADEVTDYVKKDCKGILYHFTKDDVATSIMKAGLRMKGEDNYYRLTKNKVFFVCADNKHTLGEVLHEVAHSKGYLLEYNKLNPFVRILRIDASKYNVNFYKDTAYGNNGANIVYSYAYFPPQMITDVTEEVSRDYFSEPFNS